MSHTKKSLINQNIVGEKWKNSAISKVHMYEWLHVTAAKAKINTFFGIFCSLLRSFQKMFILAFQANTATAVVP